ncbi:hypothetical protein ACJ73_07070, partial [Blastomyces percursus]
CNRSREGRESLTRSSRHIEIRYHILRDLVEKDDFVEKLGLKEIE